MLIIFGLRQTNVHKVCVLGGNLDSKLLGEGEKHKENNELKVAVLLHSGDVFLWQESDQQFCRCVYSINRVIIVKHIFFNRNELLLVSEYGEGFKGFIKPRKRKKINQNEKTPKSTEKEALNRLLAKDDCIYVSVDKIPKIHRAFFIQSDIKGKDYCILQVKQKNSIRSIYWFVFSSRLILTKIMLILSKMTLK